MTNFVNIVFTASKEIEADSSYGITALGGYGASPISQQVFDVAHDIACPVFLQTVLDEDFHFFLDDWHHYHQLKAYHE